MLIRNDIKSENFEFKNIKSNYFTFLHNEETIFPLRSKVIMT